MQHGNEASLESAADEITRLRPVIAVALRRASSALAATTWNEEDGETQPPVSRRLHRDLVELEELIRAAHMGQMAPPPSAPAA